MNPHNDLTGRDISPQVTIVMKDVLVLGTEFGARNSINEGRNNNNNIY